jgi:hypothetical protein
MAKKVDLEHDDIEKELEDEVVVEAEADDTDAVEVADVADGPGDADNVDDIAVVAEEPKPRGRNTRLTIALCALNVLAALGFTYLLILDYQKRQEWSFAVFMNELYIAGLPLKQEDDGISTSRVTMARQKLDSKQISDVFSQPQRGGKGGGEFWAVDEPFPTTIRAKDLTPAVLKDYFGSLGTPVATLEAEIARLKNRVPTDVAQVASDAAEAFKGKDDKAKRQFVAKLLLPLAYDIYQVEKLDKTLQAAKGAALDALLADVIQRRMLVDILAPCEIFRPGAYKTDKNFTYLIEKAGDLDYLKLDDLKNILDKRFAEAVADRYDGSVHLSADWDTEKRDSVEKRDAIGFLLVTIANLQKPDLAKPGTFEPLYPDGPGPAGTSNMLRAQTVLGLYEFATAAQNLPVTWRIMQQQLLKSIQIDRQGFDIVFNNKSGKFKELEGKLTRNEAFIDKHAAEIRRIQNLTLEIKKADNRLKDLQDQNKSVQKIYGDRAEHLKDMTKKLIAARVETAKQVAELRELQAQLYQAQVELRDAADRNDRLLKAIETRERSVKASKGAKTP